MFRTLREIFRLSFSKGTSPQKYQTYYYWLKGHIGGEIRARDLDEAVDRILRHLADAGRLPYGVVSTLIVLDMDNANLREITVTTPTFSLSLPRAHRVQKVDRHG